MPENTDDKILTTWGISKQLRMSILITILALMISAIIYLFVKLEDALNNKADIYEKLYNDMNNRVDERLEKPINRINSTVEKVNSAVIKVDSVASKADSVTTQILNKQP